jgi:hypothetical protein
MWGMEKAKGFESRYKKFSRKHQAEADAAMNNMQTYLQILNETDNLQIANAQPFVHSEPDGMVAIDQRGASRQNAGKLKATRLYVYAAVINKTLHLLGIGDKDSQRQDIETFRKRIKQIRKG